MHRGVLMGRYIYFVHLPHISSHLYPLEVENCDSNSRLVVDEEDNGKIRLERNYSDYSSHYVDLLTPV